MQDYWHKQKATEPLYPDLIWSRPETKRARGKLLMIGGNSFGFGAVGESYQHATQAGAGTIRVLLPLAVKKVAGGFLPDLEFAASTPSGSFSKEALGEWLDQAAWADGVLLAGDFGHNSETAILLEQFLGKYSGQVTITKDAADYIVSMPKILERPNTLLVLTMAQLQKLAIAAKYPVAFKLGMDLLYLVDALHDFSTKHPAHIVVKHLDQILVAVESHISSSPTQSDQDMWRSKTAAFAAVWWMQNPENTFEALTTSITAK